MTFQGPVTRVYWMGYSRYFDTAESLWDAAVQIKYGDGDGNCHTVAVVDENGEFVFKKGITHKNAFRFMNEVLSE